MSFVGGSAAVFGVRVRFFRRQGLFLVCLPFAAGDFHKPTSSDGGEHADLVWIVLICVLVIAVVVAVVTLVPRVRRLATERAVFIERLCTAYLPPIWG